MGGSDSGGTTASGGAVSSGGAGANGGAGGSSSSAGAGGAASGGSMAAGGTTPAGSGGATTGGGSLGSGGKAGSSGTSGGALGSGGKVGGSTGTGMGGVDGGSATSVGTGGTAGGNTGTMPGGAGGAGGGTSANVDCIDVSTTKLSFTKQYEGGSLAVTDSTKTYYSNSNWWHKFGGQTVTLEGLSMKIGNTQGASVPASDGNPLGFPTIFIGAYSGNETVGSNLPKQVSAIKSVPTIFQTNASTLDTSNLNVTYDVWFTASDAKLTARQNNPGKGGAYLMVWMFKPKDRQPRGGVVDSKGIGTPNHPATTVDGVTGNWDVWVDPSDPLCISYVSSTPIDGLAFDLNKFIQDSVTKKYGITSNMYLNIVFAGTEIWSGGDGLEIKQFCAAVN